MFHNIPYTIGHVLKRYKRLLLFPLYTGVLLSLFFQCSEGSSEQFFTPDGKGGSTARFAIVGNMLYTVDNSNLQFFNIEQAASPSFSGKKELGFDIETIFPLKNMLFVGSNSQVFAINISTPSSPFVESSVEHLRSCDPVVVDSIYGYVTLRSGTACFGNNNQLQIIDFSDIKAPVIKKTMALSSPRGLALGGNKLFVCDNGIKTFNRSDPFNPVETEYVQGIAANDVLTVGNTLLVTAVDGIYQYDFSQANLQFLSKISLQP